MLGPKPHGVIASIPLTANVPAVPLCCQADLFIQHDAAAVDWMTVEAKKAVIAAATVAGSDAAQKAVAERLAQGDIALLVQFGGGAGTFYTKKNLWTFFWGMPFFVSGGAIVSFLAVGGDGAVKAGGQVPLHSGFIGIGDIPNLITPPFSRLRCLPPE
jgi:hypothetical protein